LPWHRVFWPHQSKDKKMRRERSEGFSFDDVKEKTIEELAKQIEENEATQRQAAAEENKRRLDQLIKKINNPTLPQSVIRNSIQQDKRTLAAKKINSRS
jgi:anaerobic ribonucleoside-triphosphate reductase